LDIQQLLTRLKTAAGALSAQQLTSLALAFVAVVGLTIGSAYWLNAPTYGVLFSDMDTETAASVVTKLKSEKVAYVLDEGGRTVRVPIAKVDELRLELAGQGMPTSGRVGFEIFDRTAFGVTDFLEHVNYRRALEGELARTIGSLGDVASARVHLAMPRESLFTSQEQPAKASVVLKLRTNRPLPASTVAAITGLVAASVESLRPE
jgi:flagellar M-ring protein FliF